MQHSQRLSGPKGAPAGSLTLKALSKSAFFHLVWRNLEKFKPKMATRTWPAITWGDGPIIQSRERSTKGPGSRGSVPKAAHKYKMVNSAEVSRTPWHGAKAHWWSLKGGYNYTENAERQGSIRWKFGWKLECLNRLYVMKLSFLHQNAFWEGYCIRQGNTSPTWYCKS